MTPKSVPSSPLRSQLLGHSPAHRGRRKTAPAATHSPATQLRLLSLLCSHLLGLESPWNSALHRQGLCCPSHCEPHNVVGPLFCSTPLLMRSQRQGGSGLGSGRVGIQNWSARCQGWSRESRCGRGFHGLGPTLGALPREGWFTVRLLGRTPRMMNPLPFLKRPTPL